MEEFEVFDCPNKSYYHKHIKKTQKPENCIQPNACFMPVCEIESTYCRERGGNNNVDCKLCCRGFLKCMLWMILFTCVFLIFLYWIINYNDGFTEKKNHHPLIMTIALIIVTGLSSLIFQICLCMENVIQMFIHVFLYTVVLIWVLYDIITVDKVSTTGNIKETSIHGWLGYFTVMLFIFNYAIGLVSCFSRLFFKHTYCCLRYRFCALPLHVNMGIVMYFLVIFSTVTGIQNRATKESGDSKLLLNGYAALAILIGFIVAYKVEYAYTAEYEY